MRKKSVLIWGLVALLSLALACGDDEVTSPTGTSEPKPESTEGRPWGQPLKKPAGAPLNLG